MFQLKEVPVNQQNDIYQVTMREITEHFVTERNIIEVYSECFLSVKKFFLTELRGQHLAQSDLLEIGENPLFTNSKFVNVSNLLTKKKPYQQLNFILDTDIQLVLVQTEELYKNNGIELLSDIAASASELRLIFFLTKGNKPKVLPLLNFSQVNSQPIINVIDYRKYYQKDVVLIENMYNTLIFNLMI